MKLSIITVNLNNKEGFRKTAESVVSQTFTDYEWIVIDGGSTDGSKELIEQYSNYISYWVSEPDKGIYNAMNKGIRVSKGEYTNFLNSGDCYVDEEVLMSVFKAKHTTSDVLYGDWIDVKNGNEIHQWSAGDNISIIRLLRQNICHQSLFFMTKILQEFGYDEKYKRLADWKLNLELLAKGYNYFHLSRFVAYYDISGISSSYDELYYREKEMLQNDVFPKSLMNLINIVLENDDILSDKFACKIARNAQHHHRIYKFLLTLINVIHSFRHKICR